MIEEHGHQKHAIEQKLCTEQAIGKMIELFERETGLRVEEIDCDRQIRYADPRRVSPVRITIRAMLP